MTWLENEADWPEWNAQQNELYSDAIGRNVMICMIILQEDDKGPMLMGGRFDFETNAVELARAFTTSSDHVVEYKERMKDARKAVGLNG